MKSKMKRIQIIYILVLAALTGELLAGCRKMLDLAPLDQLSDATYFQSPNEFKLFANQYYGWLKNFTTLPGILDNPHSDSRSDLFGGGGSFGAGTNTVPTTEGNQGNAGNWVVDYQRIYSANYLLTKAAAYKTPADIAQFVAEARFFRAYVYFDLLEQYGGVPIVKTLLTPDSSQLYGPRSTRDSVADFIIADLQAAIPGLPVSIASNSTDYGRVSQMAAQALLSRVALYEGTWQEFRGNATRANALLDIAIAAGNAVINSHQYALFGTPASNALGGNSTVLGDSAQKYMFVLEDVKSNPAGVTKSANHEYILSTRYDATLKVTNQNITHSQNTGMNRKIANMFLCKDGLPVEKSPLFQGYSTFLSEYQNRDNRMRYTMVLPYQYIWKGNSNYRVDWVGGPADLKNAQGPVIPTGYGHQKWATERQCLDRQESEDYPVIRYAEVLLDYAEAVFERNGGISDADLDKSLNLVRLRVNMDNGMPPLSNAFVAANGLDMRMEIRRERAIELFDEDFRLDDIKRWHSAATDLVSNVGGVAYDNAAAFVSPWPVAIQWTGTQYQTGPNAYTAGANLPKDANGCIIIDQTARQWTEKNYLYPIPSQQLTLNPQLDQNPGWPKQ
jgi:hypothetical protein